VIKLLRKAGEVLVQARCRYFVVAPGSVHVADREVRASGIQRAAAREVSERLGPEVQRSPGQPASEILQLVVAPALGFTNLVGDRRGKQRGVGISSSSRAKIGRDP
jgi:hypothetical protein